MSGEPTRRRALQALLAAGAAPLAAGCGTMVPTHHREPANGAALTADSVLLVGRIELVPRLEPAEQKLFERNWDPFKVGDALRNSAVLFLADRSGRPRERTGDMLIPRLDSFFFVQVPLSHRYVTHALVYLENSLRVTGRRSATQDTLELWLPAPVALDLRPGDRAVYVGTWRIWRDEFHEVVRTQVLDQQHEAGAELRRRFGALPMRKALAVLPARVPAAAT